MGTPNFYDSQSPDYVGRYGRSGGLGGLLGGGSTATATAPKPVKHGSEAELWDLAKQVQDTESQRYGSALGLGQQAYAASQAANQPIDPSLLFSKAADAIGARGSQNVNALRSSLGARGLNPNSGAANGLMSRLMFQNQSDITGATRDVAIENQRARQVNAASNFANAMNLANLTNAPASGAMLETSQNIFEGDLAREGIKAQAKSNKAASKNNLIGGIIGAGASILGGLL